MVEKGPLESSSWGAQDRRSQGRKGLPDLHLAARGAGVGDAAALELALLGEKAPPGIKGGRCPTRKKHRRRERGRWWVASHKEGQDGVASV